jgi:hypothetical protein
MSAFEVILLQKSKIEPLDPLTNERIAELIADLEKQKAALHREQKK